MPEIPDTVLLEERAELAMNAVAGLPDDDMGGIPYFSADLLARPAVLRHGDWDWGSSHGRLLDACLLARHMTGKNTWREVERGFRTRLTGFFGADGLSYRLARPEVGWPANANLIDQRAVLLSLTTWFVSDGDPEAKRLVDRHVAALKRIAIKERDVWFYPASEYTPDGWPSPNAVALHLAPDPASFSGRLIMPLLRYHQATGNEDALELCGWFARLIVHKSGVYNEDGSFNAARAYRSGHFHTRLGTLEGLARYAAHTGDHELTAFARRSYDWALGQATAFGWTPGDLSDQRYEHESCSLVDLIGTGITLARSGHTAYWGVVERFLRNHLAESQLLDLSWVESAPDASGDEPGWTTHVRVGERVLGAFAGYGAPNDYVCDVELGRGHTADVQACCVGSGVRGLFWGWNSIVTGDERTVSVNLLLTRATRQVTVLSHLPHEGRVDLEVHEDLGELRLRVPSWAGYAKIRVTRDGGSGSFDGTQAGAWAPDGYLSIRAPRRGERVTVTFPVPESTSTEVAAGREYQVRWRGDDVIGISPEGTARPMYSGRKVHPTAPRRDYELSRPAKEWTW
ncbi:hypothetical protein GCM10022419_012490 [Nonomuraea rosea]|uniref:Uncharacterized protein n=1 Tax=Nonomuraea rosea TaxID=638574 RepID=A0ABP6VEY7_9ACTN